MKVKSTNMTVNLLCSFCESVQSRSRLGILHSAFAIVISSELPGWCLVDLEPLKHIIADLNRETFTTRFILYLWLYSFCLAVR